MKSMNKRIKDIIKNNNIENRNDVKEYISANTDKLSLEELSRIAELVNNDRVETSAYYTDEIILDEINQYLPEIDKDIIRILEPSVGVGNFLQLIIDKYSNCKKLIIDVNDIDPESISLLKILNQYRTIPENVEIIYHNEDFLSSFSSITDNEYDLVIGNPPFTKINKSMGLDNYSLLFNDNYSKNLASFFLQKSIEVGKYVAMIMPKYFLSTPEFKKTRERVNEKKIDYILDFGEKGFKGVLIETIGILIDSEASPQVTTCISIPKNINNRLEQSKLTDKKFPSWLLYRDHFFEEISSNMEFDIFAVYRDRQLTNSNTYESGDIRVVKSRNILRDGSGIVSITNYDRYILDAEAEKYSVSKFLNNDNVYLAPNMTYYPRVIKKPKGVVVNGSVAILIPKKNIKIKDRQIKFLCSNKFEKFYAIARNYSTRSLNIDANSIFFFGLYNG